MARRSDHTREELKELAIVAGQKIISNEGLSNFSARKVAKEMGYTVGTLYNIFGDYNDLVLHINLATLDDMHNYISERFKSADQVTDTIKKLAALYIRFANENYHRWSALFAFTLPQNTPLPDGYSDKIKALFSLIEAPLLLLMRKNKKDAERAAKVIWASIHGLCQLGLTGKLNTIGAEPIEVLTDTLIDNFIRGLES